jgi:hypothetical protein
MELDEFYTNEPLLEEYPSAFALVNHAIEIAKRRIRTGRVPDVYSENQNLAYEILDDILDHHEEEETEELVVEEAMVVAAPIIEEQEVRAEKPKRQEFKRVAPRKARTTKAEDAE